MIHLNHLHHHGITSGWGVNYMKGWLAKVVEHEADAIWKPLPPPDAHTSRLSMTLTTKLLGFKLFAATLTADQVSRVDFCHANISACASFFLQHHCASSFSDWASCGAPEYVFLLWKCSYCPDCCARETPAAANDQFSLCRLVVA